MAVPSTLTQPMMSGLALRQYSQSTASGSSSAPAEEPAPSPAAARVSSGCPLGFGTTDEALPPANARNAAMPPQSTRSASPTASQHAARLFGFLRSRFVIFPPENGEAAPRAASLVPTLFCGFSSVGLPILSSAGNPRGKGVGCGEGGTQGALPPGGGRGAP